jgi:hypothetical protein
MINKPWATFEGVHPTALTISRALGETFVSAANLLKDEVTACVTIVIVGFNRGFLFS